VLGDRRRALSQMRNLLRDRKSVSVPDDPAVAAILQAIAQLTEEGGRPAS
jgi:hypothetical protein